MTTLTHLKCYMLIVALSILQGTVCDAAGSVGPTANITKVANAISIGHKSLTTAVVVGAGLNLTAPVEISIGFYSPAGNSRITQTYAPLAGNSFLYHDRQGDGKARQMRVDITIAEKTPAGGYVASFAMPNTVTLDPLYNIAIGRLSFTAIDDCELFGDNNILLEWLSPDYMWYRKSFRTPTSRTNYIDEFAWSAKEVSASNGFVMPQMDFDEKPSLFQLPIKGAGLVVQYIVQNGCRFAATTAKTYPLVLGQSGPVKGNLTENAKQCPAYYEYQYSSSVNYYDAVTMAKLMANHSLAR